MLDIKTLMLVLALATVVSVVGLLIASLLNRQVLAIRYWAAGLACFFTGLFLQVASPPLPLWLSAVAITQAYFVIWWGTRCYRFSQRLPRFWLVMTLTGLAQGLTFFILSDSLRWSIVFHSSVAVVMCGLTIRELWKLNLGQPLLPLFWTLLWGVHGLVYLRRTLLYLFDSHYSQVTSFEQAIEIEALNYLEGTVFLYGFSLMCVILTTLRLQQALRRQATRDPLTDLLNRRAFEDAARNALALGRRGQRPLTLLLMDLDKFKSINDQHGHKTGDQVLGAFAGHLHAHARSADIICRFGGEEFVVLLPDTDRDQAQSMAERIRRSWAEVLLDTPNGPLATTVSIGLAQTCHDPAETLYSLLEQADQALYRAKQNGRNRTEQADGLRLSALEGAIL